MHIKKVPPSIEEDQLKKIILAYNVGDFSVKRSKNKGKQKACHATVTFSKYADYECLLSREEIPLVLCRGQLVEFDPLILQDRLSEFRDSNRISSLENPILNGSPLFEQEYIFLLHLELFKWKSQRAHQVRGRLTRRMYIDGYTSEDLDGVGDEEYQLSKIKKKLVRYLSLLGEVEEIFAKVKEGRILLFVTFKRKETLEHWFQRGIPYSDQNLNSVCRLLKFDGRMLVIKRESDSIDPRWYKHSSKTLKQRRVRAQRFALEPINIGKSEGYKSFESFSDEPASAPLPFTQRGSWE